MVCTQFKTRFTLVAISTALAAGSFADTAGPWSNKLLGAVPASAKGLVSIDLSGNKKPLSSVLALIEKTSGKSFGRNIGEAMKMMSLPAAVTGEFAQATDRRAVLYFDSMGGDITHGLVLVLGLKPGQTMKSVVKASTHSEGSVKYADFGGINAHVEGSNLILTGVAKNFGLAVTPLRGGPHISRASLNYVSNAIEPASEIVAWVDSSIATSFAIPETNGGVAVTGKSFGFSLGLHPKGVSISVGPVSFAMGGKAVDLSSLRPLPKNYLRTLPGGAYAVTCIANPWPAAEHFHLLDGMDADTKTSINSMKSMVRGDYVLGLYPSTMKGGKPNGIDLLLELRPNEGNNPAGQLQKLMKTVTKALFPEDEAVFTSFRVPGADHAYRLNKALASMLHLALHSALQQSGGSFDPLVKNKNLMIASVGHNVLFATSEPVLRRAVAALKYGRASLSADSKFSEMNRDNGKPTQFVLAASLSRLVSFASGMAHMASKSAVPHSALEQINAMVAMIAHWPDPLMVRLGISRNGLSARAFLPIGFDDMGKSMSAVMKASR